jgi:hypothetical protein
MKRIVMLAMALVMMLVSLGGCYWWGYEDHGGRRGHGAGDRDGDRDRDRDGGNRGGGDRGGGHEGPR